MPVINGFMHQYPQIELDLDFTDRLVDVIEEGFDAVIRSGENADSRLRSRTLGHFPCNWWLPRAMQSGMDYRNAPNS